MNYLGIRFYDKHLRIFLSFSIVLISSFIIFHTDVYAAHTISVSTSGAQNIDILPKAGETKVTSIGTDSLTVSTTCRAGYNLTMSSSVSNNNLYLNGSSSNNASGTYFEPMDGSTTLGNSTNKWGYLVSNTTPTTSSVFLAVPTVSNPVSLKTPAETASQTDISDSFNIYYGVSASSGLTPGSYKMIKDGSNKDGVISYYATMAESCLYHTIAYNSNSGSGNISSQTVMPGNSVTLKDNAFTRNNYYFKGWATSSGGAVAYRPSQTITPSDDMTLYAVWGNSLTTSLYNAIASLTRGNQTTSALSSAISKANSGVYTYNNSTFGTPSDGATTSTVYYYRGILDTNLDGTSSTYGSNGDSMNYPNFVKLGNTCWRVLRTTGSGGTKLVYNGQYGATTSGSCANSTSNTQLTTNSFNGTSNQYRQAVRVGYTFNNSYASNSTTSRALSTLFGSDSSYSGNSTNADIKTYLEDTWFNNSIGSYIGMLEPSAGYCNDRSVYDTSNVLQAESLTIPQYSTSTTQYYFGAYVRNVGTSQSPSLACPRSTVDLYTASSASNGNHQLAKPVALLTADEASFAGSGNALPNNPNSFLRTGETFWMMSPFYRSTAGTVIEFALGEGGNTGSGGVFVTYGVRPVISLKSGTNITSGSGTSTNPWIIELKSMQKATSASLAADMPNNGDTTFLIDERDGQSYTIAKIAGAYWMTRNLAIGCDGSGDIYGSNAVSKSLTSANSNIVSAWSTPTATLANSTNSAATNTTIAAMTCDSTHGAWYNFVSATAGTITGTDTSNDVFNICPAGWTIPSYDANSSAGSFNSILSSSSTFNPVTGGRYYTGGVINTATSGYWWATTYADRTATTPYRYYLLWNGSTLSTSSGFSSRGYYVRCVKTP